MFRNSFFIFLLFLMTAGCEHKTQERHYREIVIEAPIHSSLVMANDPHAGLGLDIPIIGQKARIESDLAWDVPSVWQEIAGEGMRVVSFKRSDDPESVDVSIVTLSGAAGGLEANLTRWSSQIGLDLSQDGGIAPFIQDAMLLKTQDGLDLKLFDFSKLQKDQDRSTKSMIAAMTQINGVARGGDNGFTLIEMLVSLALLALITGLLTQLVFEGRRALVFVDRANTQTPVIAVQHFLRAALTQVQPILAGGVGEQSRLGLSGDDDTMTFTTSYATQGDYQGLYRVVVGTVPNARGSLDLVAEQTLYRPNDAAGTAPSRRLNLIDNIAGVGFAYYKAQVEDGQDHWQTEWPGSIALPGLISIKIRFPNGDIRIWPALTVEPAAAASSGIACPPRVRCE